MALSNTVVSELLEAFRADEGVDLTLLCLSSSRRRRCRCLSGVRSAGGEDAVKLAGDVALEAAPDLTAGLAFGGASGDVFLGRWAGSDAGQGDGVDCAVQGSVAAAVESVPNRLAAAGRHGAGA